MKGKGLRILGFVASIIGFGLSLLTGWISDRKTDETIEFKVNEAVTKRLKGGV